MDENFPVNRNGPLPTFLTTNLPLVENDTNSIYSPMSVESNEGSFNQSRRPSSLMVEDANGVFNFQPASMAKAPVTAKSVGLSGISLILGLAPYSANRCRAWGSGAGISTSIVASPTNFSLNPHRALLSPSPTPYRCPLSKNADAVCLARKRIEFTGQSVIWLSPRTRCGALKVLSR